MKKNKKGFTLVELLVVMGIISAVMVIAIPSVFFVTKRINERMYDTKIKMILSAAEIYGLDYQEKDNLFATNNFEIITVQRLIDRELVETDGEQEGKKVVVNPIDKKTNLNNLAIKITKKKNKVIASLNDKNEPGESSEGDIIIKLFDRYGNAINTVPPEANQVIWTEKSNCTNSVATFNLDSNRKINIDNIVPPSTCNIYFRAN